MLNRVVRWTLESWEMVPYQRHVDLIIQELGFAEAKPVRTPGETENRDGEADNSRPLPAKEASNIRGMAARANYPAEDRSDIMYASKESRRTVNAIRSVSARQLETHDPL